MTNDDEAAILKIHSDSYYRDLESRKAQGDEGANAALVSPFPPQELILQQMTLLNALRGLKDEAANKVNSR